MNQLEGLLILLALPAALALSGYWLAALLAGSDARERLAFAVAAGLGVQLFLVATVNFFVPLAGAAAWACLAPALLTLLLPRGRRMLGEDLRTALFAPPHSTLLALAGFFALLLWPVLWHPSAMFYDGTSNHDSFFWIAGAEHLKRHTYMDAPVASAVQPLTNQATAIVGWHPAWGRIGAEGLLALASAIVNLSPLKLYLYGTASLAVAWFAAGCLVWRTFVGAAPSRLALAALALLQPLFVFFHGNANLPNLLGTLTGTAAIAALARFLACAPDDRPGRTAWGALTVLSLHGLLCSYPEMIPFVLLPCGLLWLRPWFTAGPRAAWRPALGAVALALAALALNPATTVRALHGFQASFASARADASWANLFAPLDLVEYVPALTTLSILGSKELEWWFGVPLSVLLLIAGALVVRRARDPFGYAAGLSGAAALLAYTVATGFAYGWQKTVQFSGIFLAVAFPAAALDALAPAAGTGARRARLARAAMAALAVFFAYSTVMNCRDTYKWSDRKVISTDWYELRARSQGDLRDAPVLVEAGSFRMAFFHGMWAAYFLPESRIYYGARGEESGGYLRAHVLNEAQHAIPNPAAILVGRPWAETIDANSPRLLAGREYALLRASNRVSRLGGAYPQNGPPEYASARVELEITPHRASELQFELRPRHKAGWPAGEWQVLREADGTAPFTTAVRGPSPWAIRVPLVAGRPNRVRVTLAGHTGDPDSVSFALQQLKVVDSP